MKDNIEELVELINFAKDVDAHKVKLLHLIGFNQELSKIHGHNFISLKYKLEKAKVLARRYRIELEAPHFNPTRIHCFEPWFSVRISLLGDIYPCGFIDASPEETWEEWYKDVCIKVPQAQYRMGNIFVDPFDKIWNGCYYKLLRKTIQKCEENIELLPEELNIRRKEIDLSKRFSYCKVCLHKWDCAC
ncbi:MAG: SPASM domain-containing protein [bacterium]|nr:SPASM domain-containing protein [bacterium]